MLMMLTGHGMNITVDDRSVEINKIVTFVAVPNDNEEAIREYFLQFLLKTCLPYKQVF